MRSSSSSKSKPKSQKPGRLTAANLARLTIPKRNSTARKEPYPQARYNTRLRKEREAEYQGIPAEAMLDTNEATRGQREPPNMPPPVSHRLFRQRPEIIVDASGDILGINGEKHMNKSKDHGPGEENHQGSITATTSPVIANAQHATPPPAVLHPTGISALSREPAPLHVRVQLQMQFTGRWLKEIWGPNALRDFFSLNPLIRAPRSRPGVEFMYGLLRLAQSSKSMREALQELATVFEISACEELETFHLQFAREILQERRRIELFQPVQEAFTLEGKMSLDVPGRSSHENHKLPKDIAVVDQRDRTGQLGSSPVHIDAQKFVTEGGPSGEVHEADAQEERVSQLANKVETEENTTPTLEDRIDEPVLQTEPAIEGTKVANETKKRGPNESTNKIVTRKTDVFLRDEDELDFGSPDSAMASSSPCVGSLTPAAVRSPHKRRLSVDIDTELMRPPNPPVGANADTASKRQKMSNIVSAGTADAAHLQSNAQVVTMYCIKLGPMPASTAVADVRAAFALSGIFLRSQDLEVTPDEVDPLVWVHVGLRKSSRSFVEQCAAKLRNAGTVVGLTAVGVPADVRKLTAYNDTKVTPQVPAFGGSVNGLMSCGHF